MGKSWFAGIGPGGEPVGTDIGGGVRKLADQRGCRQIVKAVEVQVIVGLGFKAGTAVGEKDALDSAVSTQTGIESMVGGIADERRIVGTHGEKGRKAIDQGGSKAFTNSGLSGQMAVEIVGGVEWIVSFGDVARKNRGMQLGL